MSILTSARWLWLGAHVVVLAAHTIPWRKTDPEGFLNNTATIPRQCWAMIVADQIHAGEACLDMNGAAEDFDMTVTVNTSESGWFLGDLYAWIGAYGTYPQTMEGLPMVQRFSTRISFPGDPSPDVYTAPIAWGSETLACQRGQLQNELQLLILSKVYNEPSHNARDAWDGGLEFVSRWALMTNLTVTGDCPTAREWLTMRRRAQFEPRRPFEPNPETQEGESNAHGLERVLDCEDGTSNQRLPKQTQTHSMVPIPVRLYD